jgi:hypothetical protein
MYEKVKKLMHSVLKKIIYFLKPQNNCLGGGGGGGEVWASKTQIPPVGN